MSVLAINKMLSYFIPILLLSLMCITSVLALECKHSATSTCLQSQHLNTGKPSVVFFNDISAASCDLASTPQPTLPCTTNNYSITCTPKEANALGFNPTSPTQYNNDIRTFIIYPTFNGSSISVCAQSSHIYGIGNGKLSWNRNSNLAVTCIVICYPTGYTIN